MLKQLGLRERKNADAKKALYLAALDLFCEKGFDATSVDEIAERAGFSRATFFNHFGAKQGVLRYYGQRLQEQVEELVDACMTDDPPLELILKIIKTMAGEAEAHREELKLIYLYSIRDPDYLFEPTAARKRILEIFTGLMEKAAKGGEIRLDIAPREMAFQVLSVYWGVVLAVVTGSGEAESLVKAAWKFILGGVKGGNSPAR